MISDPLSFLSLQFPVSLTDFFVLRYKESSSSRTVLRFQMLTAWLWKNIYREKQTQSRKWKGAKLIVFQNLSQRWGERNWKKSSRIVLRSERKGKRVDLIKKQNQKHLIIISSYSILLSLPPFGSYYSFYGEEWKSSRTVLSVAAANKNNSSSSLSHIISLFLLISFNFRVLRNKKEELKIVSENWLQNFETFFWKENRGKF